jgi:hypothetical protein
MLDLFQTFLKNSINRFKSKVIEHPSFRKKIKKNFRKVMHELNLEERFTQIYTINYWGSNESVSGVGSTLELTNNLRKELPKLFEQFSIHTVFDGPCGDFNWMKHVVNETGITYIGGDIVLPLIEANQLKYANKHITFKKIDLTQDDLPIVDLMICRDCLFHLSYDHTKHVLKNFVKSKTPYLLTTTYLNKDSFKNKDIVTGHFRMIDLFSAPYYFPREVHYQIDDWIADENPRFMCLWSRNQVIKALSTFSV